MVRKWTTKTVSGRELDPKLGTRRPFARGPNSSIATSRRTVLWHQPRHWVSQQCADVRSRGRRSTHYRYLSPPHHFYLLDDADRELSDRTTKILRLASFFLSSVNSCCQYREAGTMGNERRNCTELGRIVGRGFGYLMYSIAE